MAFAANLAEGAYPFKFNEAVWLFGEDTDSASPSLKNEQENSNSESSSRSNTIFTEELYEEEKVPNNNNPEEIQKTNVEKIQKASLTK